MLQTHHPLFLLLKKFDRFQTLRNNSQQYAPTTQLLRRKELHGMEQNNATPRRYKSFLRRLAIAPRRMYCCAVGVHCIIGVLVLSKNRNKENGKGGLQNCGVVLKRV